MSQIKFSGHTMGCPKWDIHEVIRRFGEIGYDGIEYAISYGGMNPTEMKKLLADLDKKHDGLRYRIFGAMQRLPLEEWDIKR